MSGCVHGCEYIWMPNQTGAEQAWVGAGPIPEAVGTSVLPEKDWVSWVGTAQSTADL